ncbi:MAG: 3-dehydroquinate synthase [Pseudomonadota bacterium]
MSAQQTVRVDLGERGYDILIGNGLLNDAGTAISQRAPGTRCLVITDEQVAEDHLSPLLQSLGSSGINHSALILRPGETTKSWDSLREATEAILSARLERGDLVVALGGGVIGDLAGFAAAIARRGMRFVQIPTSLLAQVDSSVGGKTGINSPLGKNLIGAFHQPLLVLADVATLRTLPARELRAGYAEIVKYGLIDDHDFFEWLERHGPDLLAGDDALRVEAIARSCAAKARVVAADERESGRRALLNLGHTFGHALEKLNGYKADTLVHGEGVAIGMVLAHQFSQFLGHCSGQDVNRVMAHLEAVGLPTQIGSMRGLSPGIDDLVDAMKQDKKVARGALTFILTHAIGKSFVARDVSEDGLRAFLATILAPA